jgi:hypothetical protein
LGARYYCFLLDGKVTRRVGNTSFQNCYDSPPNYYTVCVFVPLVTPRESGLLSFAAGRQQLTQLNHLNSLALKTASRCSLSFDICSSTYLNDSSTNSTCLMVIGWEAIRKRKKLYREEASLSECLEKTSRRSVFLCLHYRNVTNDYSWERVWLFRILNSTIG